MNNKHCAISVLSLLMIIYSPFSFATASDLLSQCEVTIHSLENGSGKDSFADAYNNGLCVGYINGFMDMHMNMVRESAGDKTTVIDRDLMFCMGGGISWDQVARMFVKYVKDHPDTMSQNEGAVLLKILSSAYPCKAK